MAGTDNRLHIIVALDMPSAQQALDLSAQLDPTRCALKVGKTLFTAAGPALLESLIKRNFKIFLDLKYHDITSTVSNACRTAADLGVWMLNVHAIGGRAMLSAASEALTNFHTKPILIGVTVLTSLNQSLMNETGITGTVTDQVLRLAELCKSCGLDGVVCSPQEITLLRQEYQEDFIIVTPGIRALSDNQDDQKRTMTAYEAIKAGSDYIVIGRPITQAADPIQALADIEQTILATP